ncbi:MAG: CBS domain-containing protein [Candidatus Lokiarchaeota archaeon]|nr:CBS domain-containing protein [Candidatus Lokiarchaeota archaeon]
MALKEYFVRDLVINDEYGIIDSNATIQDAAKKMKELGVPDLVVIKGEKEKVVGVIADFDIVQNVVAEGSDSKTEKVISTMYKISPVTLDTPVTEAFTQMRNLNVNVVPVVENEKLIGVCTIHDCWSYIPDQNVDEIGLIPVKNTRVAEFWFASACAIVGFVLGIILPLAGIYGYFSGNQADLLSLLGMAEIRGGKVIFQLFEARGTDFFVSFIDLFTRSGPIWMVIEVFSILLIIFGIIGLFSIIYVSFSDTRNLETGYITRLLIPGLVVFFMVFQWILFGIAFTIATPPPTIAIDTRGLIMSIISMVLFLLAINRDYIFREKSTSSSTSSEVSV